jgi:phage terminase large subunit
MEKSKFKYKPTTALYKIKALLKNISRVFVVQGGQGAGKTISILMLIIDFAYRNEGKKISIVSDELSKMKRTVVRDFLNILKDWNIFERGTWNKTENIFTLPNGSFIEFLGLDMHDVGKGMRRDLVYFNEANKLKLEAYRQVASRSKINVIDFNPDSLFWGHDLIKDNNFIQLNFNDNEYLPKEEVQSILEYKDKGYAPDGTIINEYWANIWRVYGLGEIGSVEGRIYNWKPIEYIDYLKLDSEVYYGVDWGAVDPFAVIEAKYQDGNLYVHEINYDSENDIRRKLSTTQQTQINGLENDGLISYLFQKWNIPKNKNIIADSNRPNKILTLRNSGWERIAAIGAKSRLLDRINTLQSINIIYTNTSTNIEFEQRNYSYAKDKFGNTLETPIDANNHTIDAIAYIVQDLFNQGVIKII